MKRCKSCYYRRELFGYPDFPACHFAIEEGRLRGCDPDGCIRYRPRKKDRTGAGRGRAAAEI
ncbi:MAG: hypothetical protein HFK04_01090 [Oscillospiraceae bacterium]|nr:hypothetical protein [Oscillospiraceae bacterium]